VTRTDDFAWLFALILRERGEPMHSRDIGDTVYRLHRSGDARVQSVIGLTHAEARQACERGAVFGVLEHVPGPAGGKWKAAAS
jgi:hypothetical protein